MGPTVSFGSGDALRGRDGSSRREAGAVPAKEGLGLNDDDRPTPRPEQVHAHEKLHPVDDTENGALGAATKDVD